MVTGNQSDWFSGNLERLTTKSSTSYEKQLSDSHKNCPGESYLIFVIPQVQTDFKIVTFSFFPQENPVVALRSIYILCESNANENSPPKELLFY